MENIDEIIGTLLGKNVSRWLELYSSLSGENYDASDIVLINHFEAKNSSEQWKMDVLKESRDLLIQSGIILDDESNEWKVAIKKALEQLLEDLQSM